MAQISWGHNRLIISKIKDFEKAIFYCGSRVENGWSRDDLELAIKNKYLEAKRSIHYKLYTYTSQNQSALAEETLKNPYNFDFLGLEQDAMEREIENAMIQHISNFLIELVRGLHLLAGNIN